MGGRFVGISFRFVGDLRIHIDIDVHIHFHVLVVVVVVVGRRDWWRVPLCNATRFSSR